MSGDWLKVELDLPEKPEVLQMAATLKIPETQVAGCLFMVWAWFDRHTTDGNGVGVTHTFLDSKAGVPGFARAMQRVRWLVETDGALIVPHFSRHSGETAKSRALTRRRVQKHRAGGNAEVTGEALPREEKRRGNNLSPGGEVAYALEASWTPPEEFFGTLDVRLVPRPSPEAITRFVGYYLGMFFTPTQLRGKFMTWAQREAERNKATAAKAYLTPQDAVQKFLARTEEEADAAD